MLEHNSFKVSKTGYFVYANARKDLDKFNNELIFNVQIIPYNADNSWVEKVITKLHECLQSEEIPLPNQTCKYCEYIKNYNFSFNSQLKLF